jgi:Ca2+-binding RTX toxin-like protein
MLCLALSALTWPVAGLADHIVTAGSVDARLTERRGVDYWTVEIRWTGACQGAAAGAVAYDGDIFMIDAATSERIYVGGVVDTSGGRSVSGRREWAVQSAARERLLFPELTLNCYEQFPLHGGREVKVTGTSVLVPPRFSDGGPGGAEGDYGTGDPTAPAGGGTSGCITAVVGTNQRDTLVGGGSGDVVFGLGAADRLEGRGGHDCLIGGSGNAVLRGELGSDRLTGGRGDDTLVGGPGVNAYDAGPGRDVVDARNATRELVRCGSGRDRARVDRNDRLVGCEVVSRP